MFGNKKHFDSGFKLLAEQLSKMEERLNMKLSEIKTAVALAAKQSTEAFGELSTKIVDLQKQIDDLIAGVGDPEVTDEAFLADLNTVKTNLQQLADIVPNQPPPVT